MAINPIKILDEVLQGVSLTVNISAIVDNGGGSYTLTVDNTYYLNRLSKITIDAVEYTVTDFTINTELVVSGDSLPTATSFTINQPLFLYGNPQMVSAEIVKRQDNNTLTYPYIWAVEISTTSKNLNPSAAVKATKSFNLFFFDTVDRENWVIEDHYNQDIYPLSNYIDYFFTILKSRRDLFDSDSITWNETNHVNFGDYIQDQGNREKILNDNITGIQVQAEVPFMSQGCGFTSVTKNCLPVSVTFNGLSVTPTQSGGVKNVVVVNDAVPSVQVGSVTLDNENNLNIEVPAAGGDPVNTDFNGTPTGVDTPAGDNLGINVVDLLDNPIGTLTTNTANEKKIEVDTTGDPVSTSMNGAGLTDTPAGETKAFTIRYADDSPVVVTTITDTPNTFIGEVPNPPDSINTSTPMISGASTSYFSNDDGADQDGRLTGWWNTEYNNYFGHSKRFTGLYGGYQDEITGNYFDKDGNILASRSLAFPEGIVIDWGQWDSGGTNVFCFFLTNDSDSTFTPATDSATNWRANEPYTDNEVGYTDWKMTNIRQIFNLMSYESDTPFDYIPFQINWVTSNRIQTKTIRKTLTSQNYVISDALSRIDINNSTTVSQTMLWRLITIAELDTLNP
jgi:hypothetical protein